MFKNWSEFTEIHKYCKQEPSGTSSLKNQSLNYFFAFFLISFICVIKHFVYVGVYLNLLLGNVLNRFLFQWVVLSAKKKFQDHNQPQPYLFLLMVNKFTNCLLFVKYSY